MQNEVYGARGCWVTNDEACGYEASDGLNEWCCGTNSDAVVSVRSEEKAPEKGGGGVQRESSVHSLAKE